MAIQHRSEGTQNAVDGRLLRDMCAAARAYRAAKGGDRLIALEKYIRALKRFNEYTLGRLAKRIGY
jgi:hypothetical protein